MLTFWRWSWWAKWQIWGGMWRMRQMRKLHPKAPAFRGQPTILDICQRQVGIQASCSVPAGLEKISCAATDTSDYFPLSRGNSNNNKDNKPHQPPTCLKVILINVSHAEISGASGDTHHKRLRTHSLPSCFKVAFSFSSFVLMSTWSHGSSSPVSLLTQHQLSECQSLFSGSGSCTCERQNHLSSFSLFLLLLFPIIGGDYLNVQNDWFWMHSHLLSGDIKSL